MLNLKSSFYSVIKERSKIFNNIDNIHKDILLKKTNLCEDIINIITSYSYSDTYYEIYHKNNINININYIKQSNIYKSFSINCLGEYIDKKFDLIICNHLDYLSRIDKMKLIINNEYCSQQLFQMKPKKIEMLILEKCINSLNKNGILQIILPFKFLTDEFYINYRELLTKKVNIFEINICTCLISITMINNKSTDSIKVIHENNIQIISPENFINKTNELPTYLKKIIYFNLID